MKTKQKVDGWNCDFCERKAADPVYFHGKGPKLACESCHDRLLKEERGRKQRSASDA